MDGLAAVGHRLRRRRPGARGRGRREVRGLLERAARVGDRASWSGSPQEAASSAAGDRPAERAVTGSGRGARRRSGDDARTSPRRRRRGWLAKDADAVGPGRRGRGGAPARLARPAGRPPAALLPQLAELRERAARRRPRPRRARRHGRLVAGAGGHRPHRRRATLTVLDTHRPAARSPAALRRPVDRTSSWSLQVRRHGGDRQPPPGVRAGASRDAGLNDAEIGRRFVVVTDPGSPLEAGRPGGGLPRGVPRRPARRRPLQRAVRVRPGASAPRRRRRASAARRRGGAAPTSSATPTTTPRSTSAPPSARPHAGPDKLVLADDGLRHRRLRRLGRAADRRVHRQGGQRHPAGRGGGPDGARLRRRRHGRPRWSSLGPGRPGRRAPRRCTGSARRPVPAWEYATAVAGVGPGDQPVRPAERGRVQGEHPARSSPRPATGRCPRASPRSSTAPSRCTATGRRWARHRT